MSAVSNCSCGLWKCTLTYKIKSFMLVTKRNNQRIGLIMLHLRSIQKLSLLCSSHYMVSLQWHHYDLTFNLVHVFFLQTQYYCINLKADWYYLHCWRDQYQNIEKKTLSQIYKISVIYYIILFHLIYEMNAKAVLFYLSINILNLSKLKERNKRPLNINTLNVKKVFLFILFFS